MDKPITSCTVATRVPLNMSDSSNGLTMVSYESFPEEDKQVIEKFLGEVDTSSQISIYDFGDNLQKDVNKLVGKLLSTTQPKFLGELGNEIVALSTEIESINLNNNGFMNKLFNHFRSLKKQAKVLKAKYESVQKNIDIIYNNLVGHNLKLRTSVSANMQYFEALKSSYHQIGLAVFALNMVKQEKEQEYKNLLQNEDSNEDLIKAKGLEVIIQAIGQKLYELEQSMEDTFQQAIVITELTQSTATLYGQVKGAQNTTLPRFQKGIYAAILQLEQKEAIQYIIKLREVSNNLAKRNSDLLVQQGQNIAELVAEGPMDAETFVYVTNNLVQFIQNSTDNIKKIEEAQEKGRQLMEQSRTSIQSAQRDSLKAIE